MKLLWELLLARDAISRLPAFVSTLPSRLGAVAGEAVRMTAAGIVAASKPSFVPEAVKWLSARQDAEAAANSIMAAPGRIERAATMWSHRNATAGCVSCPTKLHKTKSHGSEPLAAAMLSYSSVRHNMQLIQRSLSLIT